MRMPAGYLIALIFLLSLNLRPAITSVGPLLVAIQTELSMSGLSASLLTTLPVFCMGAFSLLSIRLNKRLGIEKSLLIAMLLIFISTFVRAFIQSSVPLIITALAAGVGIGIAGPLISGLIKKYFPNRMSVASVYSVSMVIGAAVATTFSIPLFNLMNESWRYALSFWSSLAFLAACFLLPLLLKRKAEREDVNPPSIQVTNRRVYLYMLLLGCVSAVFYTTAAWLAPFARTVGMSQEQSGYLLTLFTLIQIPISFLFPLIVSRTGKRKSMLLLCSLLELTGVLLLLGHFSPWAAATLLGIGAGGLFPLALLIPIEEATNAEEATSWSAMMQFGGFMIGALGPMLFGLAVDLFNSFMSALFVIILLISIMIVAIVKVGDKPQALKAS